MSDLIGEQFGSLKVINREANCGYERYRPACYLCQCSCGGSKRYSKPGGYTIVPADQLRKGKVISCGCCASGGKEAVQKGDCIVGDMQQRKFWDGHSFATRFAEAQKISSDQAKRVREKMADKYPHLDLQIRC